MSQVPLDYQSPPPRPPSKNRWWMVMLRIFAGLAAGLGSAALGGWLAYLTNVGIFFLLPPLAVFAGLLVVCIKYRRFGYVTGFVLAPFVVAASVFVLLLIFCGNWGHP